MSHGLVGGGGSRIYNNGGGVGDLSVSDVLKKDYNQQNDNYTNSKVMNIFIL